MSNQSPGGPMEWHSADDSAANAASRPAGFDEERREEEERRRAEEEERRREEEERRRVEEEERRREEEERRRAEEEERRREEEERRQSDRYESERGEQRAPAADEGNTSGSPFASSENEELISNLVARYGNSRPADAEGAGDDAHDADPANQYGAADGFDEDQCTHQPQTDKVRAATESHAVYGGGAARGLTRRLSKLARAGSQATRKFTDKVTSSATPARRTTDGPQRANQRQAQDDPQTRRAQTSKRTGRAPEYSSLTPQELESKLKLSLRETSVQRTSRIAVGSPKGGVGKSSIAYAVAGSIAYYTNMRVVLVDADPNFGSTRLLVPRPVGNSVVDLARDADELRGLSDLRSYVAQNEKMRLDVALGPEHPYELAEFEDLSEAYGQIDSVLGCFYDVIVYDLGLGFRDPAIRSILTFCDQLLFISDSEVIPNAMLKDAITYVANVGVDLSRTTLAVNHRLPATDESASTEALKTAHSSAVRQVTEIPYDPRMSQLLNQRAFHIEELSGPTRLGMLTTAAACIKGIKKMVEEAASIGVPVGGVVPASGDEAHPGRNGYGKN